MIKLFVYSGLFAAIFLPRITGIGHLAYAALFLACQCVLVLLSTLIAATHARYRIDQVVRYYATLFVGALGCLIIALLGW